MSFVSFAFIGFVIVSLLLYYLLPQKVRWVVLLVASYTFYIIGGAKTVIYLLLTTLTTWVAGLLLSSANKKAKDNPELEKKQGRIKIAICLIALLFNFGILYTLKYLDLTLSVAGELFNFNSVRFEFVLPLGVSFFIFQSAGYVIDQYRGKYEAQRNLFKYALFVSFFPQMVQGPISRYNQLEPQLLAGNKFDSENFRMGIQQMLWGYFKKLVIADRAAIIVKTMYADTDSYGGALIAVAVLAYCVELYCDFSGGIDITIGVAKLFGIDMTENFKRPVFALSLAEYWRRWHITLGSWMRDYVFYPLTLSKPFIKLGKKTRKAIKGRAGKVISTSLATFIVYLIIGIWHGSNPKYIVYGLWNGGIITLSLLMVGAFTAWKNKLHINDKAKYWKAFMMLRTMFIVFIGRYITRSESISQAIRLLRRTFYPPLIRLNQLWNGGLLKLGIGVKDYIIILVSLAILLGVEIYQEKKGSVRVALSKKSGFVQWIFLFALIMLVLVFGIFRDSYIASGFIYQQY